MTRNTAVYNTTACNHLGGLSCRYLRWTTTTPPSVTPALSLVDFARVSILAGGVASVTLTLKPRAMAVLTEPRCGVVENQVRVRCLSVS